MMVEWRDTVGWVAWLVTAGMAMGSTDPGTWQDAIGYNRLMAEAEAGQGPSGAGVSVSLVEAALTSEGGEYLPSADPAPVAGNFSSKEFQFRSGPAPVSFHAVRAGAFFFGTNTNALAGDASVAPLAGSGPLATVDCYQANRWLRGDFLRLGGPRVPRIESQAVGNHSWIASLGPELGVGEANEALRRVDWAVAASDHVAVVGVNNGAGTSVPVLLASAYNVISVGRTDGAHSTGTSAADVDGGGRVKPELVAPLPATSWSTAVVSSCVALLMDAGATMGPGARRSELVRAVLLAGARKDPFPAWAQTATRPLDPHFGAGEVNIWRSHQILTAGEVASGTEAEVRRSGWHFAGTSAPGTAQEYRLRIPEGCVAREFAAALVWNRQIETASATAWENPVPGLAQLDMSLAAEATDGPQVEVASSASGTMASVSHPLEYVYRRDLAAGGYRLRVTNAAEGSRSTAYGVAWFLDLAPARSPDGVAEWSPDSGALVLTFSHLGVGLTYTLERSMDLIDWGEERTLTAATANIEIAFSGPPARGFYRLVWRP